MTLYKDALDIANRLARVADDLGRLVETHDGTCKCPQCQGWRKLLDAIGLLRRHEPGSERSHSNPEVSRKPSGTLPRCRCCGASKYGHALVGGFCHECRTLPAENTV